MTAKEILQKAKANLASENNVVLDPHDAFENSEGRPVSSTNPDVCRFCLVGALLYIVINDNDLDLDLTAESLLRRAWLEDKFNITADAKPANYQRMLAIYGRAISLAGE